ncbi:MAG: hypothetical protein Solumvirus6_3 [Solumvirus sp.]|uniref:Uncharacterized protein n=1 Tax=Solumvirus sp. TaxID=2487773 RepID=A0A3G5AGW7_9VIRU|nr:MAG: hypothetical protein Solumvirus6_3 [Solumvirus sp.]
MTSVSVPSDAKYSVEWVDTFNSDKHGKRKGSKGKHGNKGDKKDKRDKKGSNPYVSSCGLISSASTVSSDTSNSLKTALKDVNISIARGAVQNPIIPNQSCDNSLNSPQVKSPDNGSSFSGCTASTTSTCSCSRCVSSKTSSSSSGSSKSSSTSSGSIYVSTTTPSTSSGSGSSGSSTYTITKVTKPSSSSGSSASSTYTSSTSSKDSKTSTSTSTDTSITSSSTSSSSTGGTKNCKPSSTSSSSSSSSNSSSPSRKKDKKSPKIIQEKICYIGGTNNEGLKLKSILTPVNDLCDLTTQQPTVEFLVRRKNRIVCFQWSPFRFVVPATGQAYITVCQTIANLPPYVINQPIRIIRKGVAHVSFIEINCNTQEQIKYYFDISGIGTNICAGDQIIILGGAITWITEC